MSRSRTTASSSPIRGNNTTISGEPFPAEGDAELNADSETATLTVANAGDRPIEVGSHFHLFETNQALKFDREGAFGMRLDLLADTSARFELGDEREFREEALRRVWELGFMKKQANDPRGATPTWGHCTSWLSKIFHRWPRSYTPCWAPRRVYLRRPAFPKPVSARFVYWLEMPPPCTGH